MAKRMRMKTWSILLVVVVFSSISYFLHRIVSTRRRSIDVDRPSFQGAIVTLTKGDVPRLLNLLHSIEYFSPQLIDRYPVIIFYDPHGTRMRDTTIKYIRSCVKMRLIFESIILFDLIENPTETINSINHEISTADQRVIGLRYKSVFWSRTVFHHPAIKNNYDYIMRIDDDCYFPRSIDFDLFQFAFEHHLDYIYRSKEKDQSAPSFLSTSLDQYEKKCQHFCLSFRSDEKIHSGFFLSRLQFWYRTDVEDFTLRYLTNDSIVLHSLDDGKIHAVLLTLASNKNRVRLVPFPYVHQTNFYDQGEENFRTSIVNKKWLEILSNQSDRFCDHLFVGDASLKQIKLN